MNGKRIATAIGGLSVAMLLCIGCATSRKSATEVNTTSVSEKRDSLLVTAAKSVIVFDSLDAVLWKMDFFEPSSITSSDTQPRLKSVSRIEMSRRTHEEQAETSRLSHKSTIKAAKDSVVSTANDVSMSAPQFPVSSIILTLILITAIIIIIRKIV